MNNSALSNGKKAAQESSSAVSFEYRDGSAGPHAADSLDFFVLSKEVEERSRIPHPNSRDRSNNKTSL
jgi:hypothetical protein